VSFENFPAFFMAHELAHQWWGQAVGWKNYHEQWLSEAFAQYFAALYAEKDRESSVMSTVLRQMRRTAIEASPDGPVYLGYRLGHIQGDDRIFRAVVYNKGAMVLHMLRRLMGDDAFFAGLKTFYQQWKYKKAGTDDFRKVMEQAAGRDLHRFFDTWIFGSEIPHVKFGYQMSEGDVIVRFEQHQDVTDVPITVAITYETGATESVVVLLGDKHTERAIPLNGRVRNITANADNAALVEIDR
jgi:aminopeptidase N